MYRAVEDQLRLQAAGEADTFEELRQRAVGHMRGNKAEYLPFFAQVLCNQPPVCQLLQKHDTDILCLCYR